MIAFRNLSIRRKLFSIVALSAAAALFFTAAATLAQQWLYYRSELVRSLHAQSVLLSANSAAALLFNDKLAATETLATFSSIHNIAFAMLHDKKGNEFAIYLRQGETIPPHHVDVIHGEYSFEFSHSRLDFYMPIYIGDDFLGVAHVQSDLSPLYNNILWSGGSLFAATLLGLLIAMILVGRMHPAITGPIGALVGLMNKVSEERNYALRAEIADTHEMGALADGFNDMLVHIQKRDAELLEAQEALLRKEKLSTLGQVAGSVGHELRNPLGVMNNAVYFLQTVLSEADETVKEYLAIIKDEIGNADRIVGDLLDSVRTKPPQLQRVMLGALMEKITAKIVVPAGVNVTVDLPDTLPAIDVDPGQVSQVFRNLVTNAIDAMPEGGNLSISAAVDEAQRNLVVKVKDSGMGIDADNLKKLFQPLFTTKARGIGLGLVVVRNLTQNNGGTVAVESEPGKGTAFTVTLPLAR